MNININWPRPTVIGDPKVSFSSFPSGCEENVVISRDPFLFPPVGWINVRIKSSADIMRLFLTTDALRRQGTETLHVVLPYLPYARQDRQCHPGEALSAKVFADLINERGYASVVSYDPHSDVMPALLDRFVLGVCRGHVLAAVKANPGATLVAPDAGAVRRVREMAMGIGQDPDRIVRSLKARTAGAVTTLIAESSVPDTCVIVDDICDGGATFIALSAELRKRGATKVVLCVTHGLFTRGIKALLDGGIDEIYTTDSFADPQPGFPQLHITPLP